MQNTEEAAKEYLELSFTNNFPYHRQGVVNAFRAGVEFAQKWHSVEEELPPEISTRIKQTNGDTFIKYTSYIVKGYFDNTGKPEAVKIAWFRPCVTKWDFRFYKKEYEPKFIITHWRPIDLK